MQVSCSFFFLHSNQYLEFWICTSFTLLFHVCSSLLRCLLSLPCCNQISFEDAIMKYWCPDNHIIYFSLTPIAKWWSVHGDPIGGDDAWDLSWDEISLWNELRPSRPGCAEHPCQQQLGVQSVWLWPVSLLARWHIWSQLHQLSSEY